MKSLLPFVIENFRDFIQPRKSQSSRTESSSKAEEQGITRPTLVKDRPDPLIALAKAKGGQQLLVAKVPELPNIAFNLGRYEWLRQIQLAYAEKIDKNHYFLWGFMYSAAVVINSNVANRLIPGQFWIFKPVLVLFGSSILVLVTETVIATILTQQEAYSDASDVQKNLEQEEKGAKTAPVSVEFIKGKLATFKIIQGDDLKVLPEIKGLIVIVIGLLAAEYWAAVSRMLDIGEDWQTALITMLVGTLFTLLCGWYKGKNISIPQYHNRLAQKSAEQTKPQDVAQLTLDVEDANESTNFILQKTDPELINIQQHKQLQLAHRSIVALTQQYSEADRKLSELEQEVTQPILEKQRQLWMDNPFDLVGVDAVVETHNNEILKIRYDYTKQHLTLIAQYFNYLNEIECQYDCSDLKTYKTFEGKLLKNKQQWQKEVTVLEQKLNAPQQSKNSSTHVALDLQKHGASDSDGNNGRSYDDLVQSEEN